MKFFRRNNPGIVRIGWLKQSDASQATSSWNPVQGFAIGQTDTTLEAHACTTWYITFLLYPTSVPYTILTDAIRIIPGSTMLRKQGLHERHLIMRLGDYCIAKEMHLFLKSVSYILSCQYMSEKKKENHYLVIHCTRTDPYNLWASHKFGFVLSSDRSRCLEPLKRYYL